TGWVMGGYKMAIGDHFLSHTLTTMTLSWLIICLITAIVFRTLHFPNSKPNTKHNQQEPINGC
ncbi:MAG TPA: PAP2 family protein, partial [Colwellia sp.]|nr:PAP2 family protein [Colwellia sp.]